MINKFTFLSESIVGKTNEVKEMNDRDFYSLMVEAVTTAKDAFTGMLVEAITLEKEASLLSEAEGESFGAKVKAFGKSIWEKIIAVLKKIKELVLTGWERFMSLFKTKLAKITASAKEILAAADKGEVKSDAKVKVIKSITSEGLASAVSKVLMGAKDTDTKKAAEAIVQTLKGSEADFDVENAKKSAYDGVLALVIDEVAKAKPEAGKITAKAKEVIKESETEEKAVTDVISSLKKAVEILDKEDITKRLEAQLMAKKADREYVKEIEAQLEALKKDESIDAEKMEQIQKNGQAFLKYYTEETVLVTDSISYTDYIIGVTGSQMEREMKAIKSATKAA